MRKNIFKNILITMITATLFTGCGNSNTGNEVASSLQVGMVTNIGSIDDKSFNQGTWEGIQAAAESFGITTKYLQPNGELAADALKEVGNLNDAGYNFIITPGFKFGTTVFEAQSKYPDTQFLIIDSIVHSGDNEPAMADNSAAILFDEHESGFLAGVATAVEIGEGDVGFIGGMPTDAVNRFNWGFQQGINYANEHLGTQMNMDEKNFVYQGTFTDAAAGQQLSAQLYDRGVDVIFSAAGAVGNGVIKEARERAANGEKVWVVGVDVDQYDDGLYTENDSVILTSAMKKISKATYDMITLAIEGDFPGGEIVTYNVANDGVGIPEENPNLSEETINCVNEVYAQIKAGQITVSANGDGLI